MSAKIDVVGNLQESLFKLKDKPEYSSVVRYAEMVIRKLEATENALKGRIASARVDFFQRTVISLAPTCADSHRQHYDPRLSVGRMIDLAGHITHETFRTFEPEVRANIEVYMNPSKP